MRKISDTNIYVAIILVAILLITGPTNFILKYITNGIGLHLNQFIRMATWTDPISNGGFPEAWTVFYICFGIVYTPLMALFITKISKGRTLRQMVASVVFGGSFGCWILFGINGGYSLFTQLSGEVPFLDIMEKSGGPSAIIAVLDTQPIPHTIIIAIFIVVTILFLATSLDAAAGSLASTASENLSIDESPAPMFRLFWCLSLSAIPLAMMFIKAPLSALQTATIVTGLPFSVVLIVFVVGLLRWFKQDYAHLSKQDIIEMHKTHVMNE